MFSETAATACDGMSFTLDEITGAIVDESLRIHRDLGPGLLESVYEACLCVELRKRGIRYKSQAPIPLVYEGVAIEAGLRLDLLVEGSIVLEVKSVERLLPVHQSQLLTYLKLADLHLGLLINFNVRHLRDGIRRRKL